MSERQDKARGVTISVNAGEKQIPGRFRPGQSGNPAGKRPGTRHRTTLALEALLDGEAEQLTRKAVEMAKDGDIVALRLCLDRLLPPRRDRPVTFALPQIKGAGDVKIATEAILSAVASGELTPQEAGEVGKLIDTHLKAIEISEFEERLSKLEGNRDEQS